MTPKRSHSSEGVAVRAAGGVRLGRADVCAKHLWRNHDGRVAVDALALQGVVVVAGPETIGVLDHA